MKIHLHFSYIKWSSLTGPSVHDKDLLPIVVGIDLGAWAGVAITNIYPDFHL